MSRTWKGEERRGKGSQKYSHHNNSKRRKGDLQVIQIPINIPPARTSEENYCRDMDKFRNGLVDDEKYLFGGLEFSKKIISISSANKPDREVLYITAGGNTQFSNGIRPLTRIPFASLNSQVFYSGVKEEKVRKSIEAMWNFLHKIMDAHDEEKKIESKQSVSA